MPDAAHHCAAWRIAVPAIDRALDAGEPGGSAGRPILAQLVGRDVVDACIVVTRYFGGVKLGVGGLVRAYGGAASAVLDALELVPRIATVDVELTHGYEDTREVERILTDFGVVSSDVRYGDEIHRMLTIPADPRERDALDRALADGTAGRVRLPPRA
jgi:putative IMPACT (imprinted ancient) family translation regulator